MSKYQIDSLFAEEKDNQEAQCNDVIRVAFESGADAEFDYLVADELWPIRIGQRVEAPFGRKNKIEVGFCVGSTSSPQVGTDISHRGHREAQRKEKKAFKLKKISRVVDKEPLIDVQLMELARWISSYYVCPLGQVLSAMVPGPVKKGVGVTTQTFIYLAAGSEKTIEQLKGKKQRQVVDFLKERKAYSSSASIELQKVLEGVDCGRDTIKKLAEKQIIEMHRKTMMPALPVVPAGMLIKTDKVVLNEDQRKALAHINAQLDSGEFGVTVLYGVTDSGKTELYMRAIEAVLQKGKSAIVLLPEIALTAQTVQRFGARFERMAVMHSGLKAAARNVQWQRIRSGEADVVIGARSAVFSPLPRLGLIIVDEEHEPSYKQDTVPRYNGRDVAIKRAQLANAHCILGSATPSLETLSNCQIKKYYSLVRLPKRVMDLPMPEMKLVDLQKEPVARDGVNLISEVLRRQIEEVLAKKEQAILLLNRRGYSNFVFCPACKYSLRCRNCDVALTFHKWKAARGGGLRTVTGKHIDYGYALCHYCLAQTLVPVECPLCGKKMAIIGFGSQRLEEEVTRKFPQARVARIDSDAMTGKDYYRVLKDFNDGRIDILAGTQMLAKGLHFPNVTLVGIISADTSLCLPDFRANERTFQLISQVAGRAGRSIKKGVVFVQTFFSNQPAIQFALRGDFEGFVSEELKHRRNCNLPPFWRLAVVGMRAMNFDRLDAASKKMREKIDQIVERDGLKVTVRGPMPAVISRIQRFHRMQIIIQAPDARIIQQLFAGLRAEKPVGGGVRVAIDVDPVNLL